ncbi:MAG: HAMP domain-containing protein [Magnetococcales bacterium]|nr:HAMP domain-containing protein [Magnetococcales bacterium]
MNPTWRPWPASLGGRLALLFLGGITLSLGASALLHLQDRDQALAGVGGFHTAERLAAIVQVLDPLDRAERRRIIAILRTPLQQIRLLDAEPPPAEPGGEQELARSMEESLTHHLGSERSLRITVINVEQVAAGDGGPPPGWVPAEERVRAAGDSYPGGRHRRHHAMMMQRLLPHGVSFLAQIRLQDGAWVVFHNHLPREVFDWPQRLLASMALLFLVAATLAVVGARLATRPMATLARAARGLGQDLNQPPIAETGPTEVREAANAFNVMQARLQRYVQERTRLLAALSHDLKTPLTRMRLRVEMLKDERLKAGLLPNLTEMERMAGDALAFIQGMEGLEQRRPTDVAAMLDHLQEAFGEMAAAGRGGQVTVATVGELAPFPLMGESFKRCLTNLVDNALKYGGAAHLEAAMAGPRLHVLVTDPGPGIPEAEIPRMLEPFTRLDESRNRDTGGAGLGLAIAHNIVRAHGGTLTLTNRPQGGLQVDILLPPGEPL